MNVREFLHFRMEKTAGSEVRRIVQSFKRGSKRAAKRLSAEHKKNIMASKNNPELRKMLQYNQTSTLPKNLREFQTTGKRQKSFIRRLAPEYEKDLALYEKHKGKK